MSYGLLTGWAVRYTCCQTTSAYRMRVLMRYGATTPIRTAGRSAPTYPEALSSASMTVFDGKLYVYGEAGETMGRWLLVLSLRPGDERLDFP